MGIRQKSGGSLDKKFETKAREFANLELVYMPYADKGNSMVYGEWPTTCWFCHFSLV